jgi:hypothetical protein
MVSKQDLLTNLLMNLTTSESNSSYGTQTSDNTLIQKMIAPNEVITTNDTFTFSNPYTPLFLWGGTGVIAGWVWNQGQYSGYGTNMLDNQLNEIITSIDTLTFLNPYLTAVIWGGTGKITNWLWNQGQWH